MGENKRTDKRSRQENKLVFEIISSTKDLQHKRVYYTFTKDISLGGVSIRTDTFLPIDTVVEMKLRFDKEPQMIVVRAKVRWVKSLYDDEVFKVGLEFVDTSPKAVNLLINHLFGK